MQHSFTFDPTYGHDEASLRSVGCPAGPEDFESFWQETYALAKQVPPNAVRRSIRESRRMKIYEVEFDAWDIEGPIRIGGWMTVPGEEKIDTGLVVGHGYGGRAGPDLSSLIPTAAAIYPCARGFNRSARTDIPDLADRHVLHGIESRETYVHRGCVVDLWAAAWALCELEPKAADWLCYAGASFGGGIGALALPWEPLFKRAFLDVPSFGHHPLRLTMQCVGSGEAVRQSGGEKHLPVLRYFDSATAATHVRIPTLVAAAVFDPAVPPPGQFAVYNCLGGPKKLFVRQAAHFDWPGGAAEDRAVQQAAGAIIGNRHSTGEPDSTFQYGVGSVRCCSGPMPRKHFASWNVPSLISVTCGLQSSVKNPGMIPGGFTRRHVSNRGAGAKHRPTGDGHV